MDTPGDGWSTGLGVGRRENAALVNAKACGWWAGAAWLGAQGVSTLPVGAWHCQASVCIVSGRRGSRWMLAGSLGSDSPTFSCHTT